MSDTTVHTAGESSIIDWKPWCFQGFSAFPVQRCDRTGCI